MGIISKGLDSLRRGFFWLYPQEMIESDRRAAERGTLAGWVPLAIMAASAVASAFGNKKKADQQNKAAKDQADLNNKFINDQAAARDKIMQGLQASGYNPFGINTLQSGGSSTSTTRGYEKSNPFITEDYKKQDDLIRGILENRLSRGSSLPPGYEASAIRAVNDAAAGGNAAANNAAARMGLSGQQGFAVASRANSERAGKIADIRANTPLLERELANEDIGISGDRQKAFGTGQERRYNSTTNESRTGWNQQGPNVSDLATLLMPTNPNQSTVNPNSGWGSTLGALGQGGMAIGGAMYGAQQGQSTAAPSPTMTPNTGANFATPPMACPGGRGSYPFCY